MPYELQMARHPAAPLGTLDEPLKVVAQERTANADATSPTRMWYLRFSSDAVFRPRFGKAHDDAQSLATRTFVQLDGAAVRAGDLAHDGEAETGAVAWRAAH